MTCLHSPLTLLLLLAAVLLTLWGACDRRRDALSFFGGLFCAAAMVSALVEGAQLQELLLYALALLALSLPGRRRGRGETP